MRDGMKGEAVAVFGAAGHTGRFVVEELSLRGIRAIAIARDTAALGAARFSGAEVVLRQATVEDARTLDRAMEGAALVINCAGPFLDTEDVVASAAVRAGIHYLDVTAEQASAQATLAKFDSVACEAGVVVVPSVSFYGGFADLLVTAALGEWEWADGIDVMIGLDSWHPTRGTRITGERNTAERLVIAGGRLAAVSSPRAERSWDFDGELGRQAMVETPFSEVVLVARHVKTRELHTWLNRLALDDIHSATTPAPKAADESGRSRQTFVVEVVAERGGNVRRVRAGGRDIYAFSATLVCEVAERLLKGKVRQAGARALGEVVDAREVLSALSPDLSISGLR